MRRSLKTSLLWLLLAVFPIQGFASATMMFCGLNASASPGVTHEHAGHTHGVSYQVSSHHPQQHDVEHGQCIGCAPCCAAAAINLTSGLTATPPAHIAPLTAAPAPLTYDARGGPDRPPRGIPA